MILAFALTYFGIGLFFFYFYISTESFHDLVQKHIAKEDISTGRKIFLLWFAIFLGFLIVTVLWFPVLIYTIIVAIHKVFLEN